MSALAKILSQRIAQHGPLNLADYMGECLLHPDHGYYTQQEAFGRSGDFITAPEISQMFGEMIGLSLGATWQAQGAAKDAITVESITLTPASCHMHHSLLLPMNFLTLCPYGSFAATLLAGRKYWWDVTPMACALARPHPSPIIFSPIGLRTPRPA